MRLEKFRNDELHILYLLPNITRVTKRGGCGGRRTRRGEEEGIGLHGFGEVI